MDERGRIVRFESCEELQEKKWIKVAGRGYWWMVVGRFFS